MLHGRTKIELYNPTTKVKEVIRSENTFQGAVIAKALRGMGESKQSPYFNSDFSNAPIWQKTVGGIFLFRDQETSGNQYMTVGNKMIGNGSYGVVNNGTPNELGSYNSQESSASASAITQVYDFSTQQANGTTGCVCLTSQTGGFIGYGNDSQQVNASGWGLNRDQNTSVPPIGGSGLTEAHIIVGNMSYRFSALNGVISLTKRRVTLTQGSIFDRFDKTPITFDLTEIGNHLNVDSQTLHAVYDGGYIYILPAIQQILETTETMYYYKYNIANDTMTEESFTNTSENNIYPAWLSFSTVVFSFCVSNGTMACRTIIDNVDKIALFNLANGTHIEDLDLNGSNQRFFAKLGTNLSLVSSANINQTNNIYVYDHEYKTLRPTNGVNLEAELNNRGYYYEPTLDAFVCCGTFGDYLVKNPLYLATINNLGTPVTKTAAQTMKVTYTLTEA